MNNPREYPYCFFNYEKYNPVQEKCFPFFTKDVNLILSSSVASGKTLIAEAIFGYELKTKENSKVIYICPLKALADEKLENWKNHPTFSKYNISVLSSDYFVNEDEIEKSRIIISTIEAMDIRCRRKEKWLLNVSALVFDEAHLFGQDDRGASSEAMLMSFTRQNNECRIICLSGTMTNSLEFAKWVKSLNNKKTQLINSNWRPTKLEKELVLFKNFEEQKEKILEQINENTNDKILIFVNSKKNGIELEKFLRSNKIKCVFISSDLNKNIRKALIFNYKNKFNDLNVIISTSLLGAGIDL